MEDFFLMCVNNGVNTDWYYDENTGCYSLNLRKGDYGYSYAFSVDVINRLSCSLTDVLLDRLKVFIEVIEDEERANHQAEIDI